MVFNQFLAFNNTTLRESEEVPWWKVEPKKCSGNNYQDVMCWKFLFRSELNTQLQEMILLRSSKAPTLGSLSQANLTNVKGFPSIPVIQQYHDVLCWKVLFRTPFNTHLQE